MLALILIPLLVPPTGQLDFITVLSIIGIPTIISSAFAFWINRNTLRANKPAQEAEVDIKRTQSLGETIDRLASENSRLDTMNTNLINRVKALEDNQVDLNRKHEREISELKHAQAIKFRLIEEILRQKGIEIPPEISDILQMV